MSVVLIEAKPLWNKTGIQVIAGQQYSITASGEWVDWFIHHGPEGDPSESFYMKAFEPLRRMKNENWFALIGALDQDMSTAFPIGAGCQYTAPKSGELTCFANDVEGFYWNNYGAVQMTVTLRNEISPR
jgi:hypothetical protein